MKFDIYTSMQCWCQEATDRVFDHLCEIVDSSQAASAAAAGDQNNLQLVARQVIADGEFTHGHTSHMVLFNLTSNWLLAL